LVKPHIKEDAKKPQVIKGIDKILDWLRRGETSATFFVVGEILESNPEILDKITGGGHEIAFHTMYHDRLDVLTKDDFVTELNRFSELTGGKSKGFRAPTFSLNQNTGWAIDILTEYNYLYDSSIVPAKTRLYGVPSADTKPYKISANKIERDDTNAKIVEFPLMVTRIWGKKMPVGGGFYLRFLPSRPIENAIKRYEDESKPATFYIHSWELTPEYMPRVPLPYSDSFITYHNLAKAMPKMDSLIRKFKFTSFEKYVKNYMN